MARGGQPTHPLFHVSTGRLPARLFRPAGRQTVQRRLSAMAAKPFMMQEAVSWLRERIS